MRLQDGDVLIGKAGEYDVEFTVTKVCKGDICWSECDAEVMCNGEMMTPVATGARMSERAPHRRERSRAGHSPL